MRVFAANHAAGTGIRSARRMPKTFMVMSARSHEIFVLMFDFNIVIGNSSWSPARPVRGQRPGSKHRQIYNERFPAMYLRACRMVNGRSTVPQPSVLDANITRSSPMA